MQENHASRNLKADFYGGNTKLSHLKHSETKQHDMEMGRNTRETRPIKNMQHIQTCQSHIKCN
jgi:hypothetical protein